MLFPSVDGIAQFHGIGHLSCLGYFLHSSPDGIAHFDKICGVRKRCQKRTGGAVDRTGGAVTGLLAH